MGQDMNFCIQIQNNNSYTSTEMRQLNTVHEKDVMVLVEQVQYKLIGNTVCLRSQPKLAFLFVFETVYSILPPQTKNKNAR